MKKFYLYIICTMIVSYIDAKYNFKSILLFTFFIISIPFIRNKNSYLNILYYKIDKFTLIYLFMFSLGFACFFCLLPYLIFRDYSINKTGSYSNYGILKGLLISPLLEELIFRGSLLPLMIKTESSKKVILLSALGFSLAHYLSSSSLFATFILGAFCAYIYIKTKSLILCIIVHVINNFGALVFFPFVISAFKIKETSCYLLIVLAISAITMLFSFIKVINKLKI